MVQKTKIILLVLALSCGSVEQAYVVRKKDDQGDHHPRFFLTKLDLGEDHQYLQLVLASM